MSSGRVAGSPGKHHQKTLLFPSHLCRCAEVGLRRLGIFYPKRRVQSHIRLVRVFSSPCTDQSMVWKSSFAQPYSAQLTKQHSVTDPGLDGAATLITLSFFSRSELSASAVQMSIKQRESVWKAVGLISKTSCTNFTPCSERFHSKFCFEWVIPVAAHIPMLYLKQAETTCS